MGIEVGVEVGFAEGTKVGAADGLKVGFNVVGAEDG